MLSGADRGEGSRGVPLHYLKEEFYTEREDIATAVRLPRSVTGSLAEEIGVHLSDGHMNDDGLVSITGHAKDDRAYLYCRVVKLLKKVWGIRRVIKKEVANEFEGKKWLELRIYSRKLVKFKERVLELPSGKKDELRVPSCIMNHRKLMRRMLCGLFDGDGSLSFKSKWGLGHTYPVLSYSSSSETLMRQLQSQLRGLGFVIPKKLWKRNGGTWYLAINGDSNYERWMNLIGFNNPKHLTKVVLYERDGIVPPETGLKDREKLISGKVSLSEIYPVDELRVNTNRLTEKQVLEKLAEGKNYVAELGRLTDQDYYCVKKALRRLSKMGLAECDEKRSKCNKKYFGITLWGVNKLNRVERIVKRLREEYNLAV